MKTFLNALLQADIEQIKIYINKGVPLNECCSNGQFPLHAIIEPFIQASFSASFNFHCIQKSDSNLLLQAIKLLIKAGANINSVNKEG